MQCGEALEGVHVLQCGAAAEVELLQCGEALEGVHVLERGAKAEAERLQCGETLEDIHVFVLAVVSKQSRGAEMVEHFVVAAKVGD